MYIFALAFCLLCQQLSVSGTALDDYVNKADDNYKYEYMGEAYDLHGHDLTKKHTWTGYCLNMTSQRWLTDADFSPDSTAKSIWWHMLVVIVPSEIKYTSNATLYITGGNQGGPPGSDNEDIVLSAALAMGIGAVTGALFQIPNEHVIFAVDPLQKSRTEDSMVAFTWDHFLNDPSEPEWLNYFPMVKASVRAMDTMTDFIATQKPELGCQLDYYTVAGASKRGWTTWLVGAVDKQRTMAIVPIVLDAINFVAVEHHEWTSYGAFGFALQDYIDMDVMSRLDTPQMAQMQVRFWFWFWCSDSDL